MQRCRSTVRSLVALIIVIAAAIPAGAATVRRLELDELRSRAESVFAGQVLGISSRAGSDGRMVWTDYQIEVSDVLAGRDPGSLTTLSFAGGDTDGLSIGVPGVPQLRAGDHYVFFIEPRPDASKPALVPTVGWGQGPHRNGRGHAARESATAPGSAAGPPPAAAGRAGRAWAASAGPVPAGPGRPARWLGIAARAASIFSPDSAASPSSSTGCSQPTTSTPTAASSRSTGSQ